MDDSDDDWDVSDDDLDQRFSNLNVNKGPNFDDEVDLAVKEKAAAEASSLQENKRKGKALADKKAAEAARKEEEEIARRAVELEAEAEANMTPEERKMHERRRVEEADNALTDDLFGGGGGKSNGATSKASVSSDALVLKDLKDHLKHARKVAGVLRDHGKIHFSTAFFKECISQSSAVLDEDAVSELIKQLNVMKNEKVQASKRKVKGQAQKSKKQDKIAAAQARKIHDDTFGDNDQFDAYDEVGEDYEDAFF